MTGSPASGVVARWTVRRRPAAGAVREECSTVLVDVACDQCGELARHPVGMIAVVVQTPAGPQLVIAERTAAGDWAPTRRGPATVDTVRALRRPGATGPGPVPAADGGLW